MSFNKDVFFKIKGVYLLYFEILLILRAMGPWLLLPTIYDTVLYYTAGIIGLLILFIDFIFSIKNKQVRKYDIWLILFIVIMGVSSIFNLKYGLFENIKLLMWQLIIFFIVYQFGKDYGQNKFTDLYSWILRLSWFIANSVSVSMFVIHYAKKIPIKYKYYPVRLGWLGNRLFGVFTDPNFGAVISVIVIFMEISYLVYRNRKSLFEWIFSLLNIFVQFSFISLSVSRTAQVVLISLTMFYLFFIIYSSKKLKPNRILKIIVSIIIATVVSLSVYELTNFTKEFYAKVPNIYQDIIFDAKVQKDSAIDKNTTEDKPVYQPSFNRPDVNSDNVSNLRFQLWNSSFQIFKSSPLLGGSPGNYLKYAHDKLPKTLMGHDKLTAHNLFFLVLASTGLLGIITLFGFLLKKSLKILKYLFTSQDLVRSKLLFYILYIFGVAVSAMFITELVLVSTIGAITFWMYLGVLDKSIADKSNKFAYEDSK